jgi:two-component system, NarL family, nitrate/nitrite response regulator NarL
MAEGNIESLLSPFGHTGAQSPQTLDCASNSINSIVIDFNSFFRIGLVEFLRTTNFRVVGDFSSVGELPPHALGHGTSLLILGVHRMTEGEEVCLARLKRANEHLRVLVLGAQSDLETGWQAIAAGADCYLCKERISPDLLFKSLELTLIGAAVVTRECGMSQVSIRLGDVDTAWISNQEHVPTFQTNSASLSRRERLTLSYLAQGASNKHIARQLGISEATVKVYVKSILRKLRVRNRTQAAMHAIEERISTAD